MTKEVKKKGIEIGAGIVLYLTVWAASVQTGLNRQEETAVFLLPYIVLALETYKSLFRQIIKLRFPDEDLLIVIATVGGIFCRPQQRSSGGHAVLSGGKDDRGDLDEPDKEVDCGVY